MTDEQPKRKPGRQLGSKQRLPTKEWMRLYASKDTYNFYIEHGGNKFALECIEMCKRMIRQSAGLCPGCGNEPGMGMCEENSI